jgi:hypothetical protein
MKAKEFIKKVQEIIDTHGEDVEVFVEAYYSGVYSLSSVSPHVSVDTLSDFPESKVAEHHGKDEDGPGIIYGVMLYGHDLVQENKR